MDKKPKTAINPKSICRINKSARHDGIKGNRGMGLSKGRPSFRQELRKEGLKGVLMVKKQEWKKPKGGLFR